MAVQWETEVVSIKLSLYRRPAEEGIQFKAGLIPAVTPRATIWTGDTQANHLRPLAGTFR